MISATSRYAASTVVTGLDLHGMDTRVIVFSEPVDTSVRFTYHQVTGADTIDRLAYQNYKDATLWWVIANANPEISNWSVLTPGYLLRIPAIPVALT